MKLFIAIAATVVLSCACFVVYPRTTGVGCNLNGSGLYITYLGDANYYGSSTDIRPVYSNSTSPASFITRNVMGYKSSGNHYNYICGQINEFYSDYGPTQMEQTSLNKPCEVAPTASTPSGSASHGTLYQYSINNSTYCTTTTTPMPLDDHIFAIGAVICFIGFGWIKKMVV